jgi:hypothetical protein
VFLGQERDDFLAAIRTSNALGLAWCTGGHADYPAHGILRQAAVLEAGAGAGKAALERLARLRRARAGMVLSTIVLAATVEVAGLLLARDRLDAVRLLDNEKDDQRPGALQLLEALDRSARESVPELWGVFAPWRAAIEEVLGGSSRDPRGVLLGLARAVPY